MTTPAPLWAQHPAALAGIFIDFGQSILHHGPCAELMKYAPY
jgi:hypothetical protein